MKKMWIKNSIFGILNIFLLIGTVGATKVVEFNFNDGIKTGSITNNTTFISNAYTADNGIVGNINTSTISLIGGPTFDIWTQGADLLLASSPNTINRNSGENTKYWMINFSTIGYGNLTLSSKQRSSNTGPRDFKVQYSTGGIIWNDVPSSNITVNNNFTSGILSGIILPIELNNQSDVYLRWVMTSNTSVNSSLVAAGGTQRIDDIIVEGSEIYTLHYTGGSNGIISGENLQTVFSGGNGNSVVAIPNDGYIFNNRSDGSTENPRTDINISGDVSVSANFILNQHIVTFQDYDNSIIYSGLINYGSSAIAPTNPTRTGYTFSGWNPSNFTNITGETIIIAEYNINQYTMTFDTDGGTPIAPITDNYNANILLPNNPIKTGYIFSGWLPNIPTTMQPYNTTYLTQWNEIPTIYFITSTPGPTSTNFTVDIIFSTGVIGFESDDIILSNNALKGSFNEIETSKVYRLTINPISDGNIFINITTGAAQDILFNTSTLGVTNYLLINADLTDPIISINNPGINSEQNKTITASTNEGVLFQSIVSLPICNGTLPFIPYNNIIFNNENDNGKYVCYRAIDLAGNISYKISDEINGIDTTQPIISELNPITSPTNNTNPIYEFITNESGTIHYSGGCTSATYSANIGYNNIEFETLIGNSSSTGNLYNNCTINISDIAGNISNTLYITPFIVDTISPNTTIYYNITGLTNQNVNAILSGYSEPITIINNSGHNGYTFLNNGSFIFEFIDMAGNTGSSIATINNIDKIAPIININGSNPLTVQQGSFYSDLGAGRSDNISGTGNLLGSGIVNTSILGSYIITYTITDEAGNTTISNRVISVVNSSSAGGGGGQTIYIAPENNPSQTIKSKTELETAYERAFKNSITTLSPINNARLDQPITRGELAKMISIYANKILNKKQNRQNKGCENFLDNDQINKELSNYIKESCLLGIMGLEADGETPLSVFNPNDIVTRAQFSTVLSRILYGNQYNNNNNQKYREAHIKALQTNNILTVTNSSLIELRGRIILMLYRTK